MMILFGSAFSAISNILAEITEMAGISFKRYESQEQLLLQESNIDFSLSPVDHDPDKRTAQLTKNEKRYLIKVVPQQPKLAPFPRNEKISSTKQCRCNSDWYSYPYLEYGIENDAASCFTCQLFPFGIEKGNSESAWITGIRKWGKMKGSHGKDTPFLSIFRPNAGKCGPDYLQIRTRFTQ